LTEGGDEALAAAGLAVSHAAIGEGLDVCFVQLDVAYLDVRGTTAPPVAIRAAAVAWAESMQAHYNGLSCSDPLTGLSSLQHLQSRVAALYRAADHDWLAVRKVADTHAIVVIGIISVDVDNPSFNHMEHAMRQAIAADTLGELLPQAEQPAVRLTPHCLAALARQTPELEQRVGDLAEQLNRRLGLSALRGRCSMWIETLPDDRAAARRLLDELAR
jgi:hypothetical protein